MCKADKENSVTSSTLTGEYLHWLRITTHVRLNHAAWGSACDAGVALRRPTHRGCRGGGGATTNNDPYVCVSQCGQLHQPSQLTPEMGHRHHRWIAANLESTSTLLCPPRRLPLTRMQAAVSRYRSNWVLSTLAQFSTKLMCLRITWLR